MKLNRDLKTVVMLIALANIVALSIHLLHSDKKTSDLKFQKTQVNKSYLIKNFSESNRPIAIKHDDMNHQQQNTALGLFKNESHPVEPIQSLSAMEDYFFREIPKKEMLQKLSVQETHFTPAPIKKAAVYLAHARDFFKNYPQPLTHEIQFYLKCAQAPDLFTSVRAVCAARMSEQFKKLTGKEPNSKIFDTHVAQIKDQAQF